MTLRGGTDGSWKQVTEGWGSPESVALYLDRCQVDTPSNLVNEVWAKVAERRERIGRVIDFGAGDARFARGGNYAHYVGYEVDPDRCGSLALPRNAELIQECAFSQLINDADLCIGNPPYVRNQDLPEGWRQLASEAVAERTQVSLSGLANAWQYFFLLALASTRSDGLVAIVVPYEWVSRPSAKALREYIHANGWDVLVYRLSDDRFDRVLTTSSITIVDKRNAAGAWRYFEETPAGPFRELPSASGGKRGVLKYSSRSSAASEAIRAKRGLSPGTQEVLTLTEGERARAGLSIDADVVPCVTTLRDLDPDCLNLTSAAFKAHFRDAGRKCWLLRTDRPPSERLQQYLDAIPKSLYQTATCKGRELWWNFLMPQIPSLLAASSFRGNRPKVVSNTIGARAVGGVYGIYGVPQKKRAQLVTGMRGLRLTGSIVAHSNGLRKLEVNQLNTLLKKLTATAQ